MRFIAATIASSTIPIIAALPPAERLPLADVSQSDMASFSKLQNASAALEPTSTSLNAGGLGATTQNDINNGVCKPMTILFARGTTESGNMGTLTGPPFVTAVGAAMGADSVAVQGIDYPADIPGFLAGGDKGGSSLMAKLVGQVMASCPTTKLVMAGYSQGGQLVHKAANMLTAVQTAFVNSAVIFGDPDDGKSVGKVAAAKTRIVCHQGDLICAHQDVVFEPHLTYSMNAGDAAKFVASAAGAR